MSAAIKKKRDRGATQQALVEAAIAVFSEHGYDAATTREVAKRAKVSEALIQRYFEGKAGLLHAITDILMKEGNEELLANLPFVDTLEEEILQVLTTSCTDMREKSDFIRVVMSRAIVDEKLGKQMGAHVHQKKIPLLKTRLLHYQAKGQIAQGRDLNAIAFSISGLSFLLGFMASEVFAFDRNHVTAIAKNLSGILARGAGA